MPAIYESVWTKVGLRVELYTNPPSDLYSSIMLLHNSNPKSEALHRPQIVQLDVGM